MKKMNLMTYSLIFAMLTMLFAGCSNYEMPNASRSVEQVEVCEPVTEIEKEELKMIKSITEFKNYFITGQDGNRKLFGLDEQGKKEIEIIDVDGEEKKLSDFFVKSGCSYLTIVDYGIEIEKTEDENGKEIEVENQVEKIRYFKQEKDIISEIESLPAKPKSGRSEFSNKDYEIYVDDYNGITISKIANTKLETGGTTVISIDGFSYFENVGMFYNVKEGNVEHGGSIQNGLYFYPINRTVSNKIHDSGEIW